MRGAYKNKQIPINSDSQAARRALCPPKVSSKLVSECLQRLTSLADQNNVKVQWVQDHADSKLEGQSSGENGTKKTIYWPRTVLGSLEESNEGDNSKMDRRRTFRTLFENAQTTTQYTVHQSTVY